MKIVSQVTIGLGLLLGSGIGAMAKIAPANDLDFANGFAESFVTNNLSIDVGSPEKQSEFTAPEAFNAYLPGAIGNSKYTDPYSFSFPTSGGEKGGISNAVLPVNHVASVADIVATPEPSGLPLVGAGALLIGMLVRRKLVRAS
jgi:hypothetical protein